LRANGAPHYLNAAAYRGTVPLALLPAVFSDLIKIGVV